jgi:hypothetical protein
VEALVAKEVNAAPAEIGAVDAEIGSVATWPQTQAVAEPEMATWPLKHVPVDVLVARAVVTVERSTSTGSMAVRSCRFAVVWENPGTDKSRSSRSRVFIYL